MNYYKEVNSFYNWLETNPLSSSAIVLWHALMNIANKSGWQTQFTVAVSVLEYKTGLKRDTIYHARNKLQEAGRLKWVSREGNQCAIYEMIPLETFTNPPSETTTQMPTETPAQIPTQTPTETTTQMPSQTPTQTTPTQTPTQIPTQIPTQTPTQMPSQTPALASPTQTPTQSPTQVPTQSTTQLPTQTPTQLPTQPPTITKRNETIQNKTIQNDRELSLSGDDEIACLQTPKPPNKSKCLKATYGEFDNVLLTVEEHEKLLQKFGTHSKELIERLSEYIASKNARYTSHYATMLSWARKDELTSGDLKNDSISNHIIEKGNTKYHNYDNKDSATARRNRPPSDLSKFRAIDF